jgi:hypothetical protein
MRRRLAIIGLGRVGKACGEAIAASEDLSVAGIVRRPQSRHQPLPPSLREAPVALHASELADIDAALICLPAALVRAAALAASALPARRPLRLPVRHRAADGGGSEGAARARARGAQPLRPDGLGIGARAAAGRWRISHPPRDKRRILALAERQGELIDRGAGKHRRGNAFVLGSDLDATRITGILDPAVAEAAAQPLLTRPQIEGITAIASHDRADDRRRRPPRIGRRRGACDPLRSNQFGDGRAVFDFGHLRRAFDLAED